MQIERKSRRNETAVIISNGCVSIGHVGLKSKVIRKTNFRPSNLQFTVCLRRRREIRNADSRSAFKQRLKLKLLSKNYFKKNQKFNFKFEDLQPCLRRCVFTV